jgi:hypothetical protein
VFVHLGRLQQFSEVPDLSSGQHRSATGSNLDISDAALTCAQKLMSDLQPQALLLLQAAYRTHRKALLKRQHHLPSALHQ